MSPTHVLVLPASWQGWLSAAREVPAPAAPAGVGPNAPTSQEAPCPVAS
jgi:hypothetical protein